MAEARKQKVWIDADTGNETDDAYAIVRALVESGIDVVGVSSVHFNNPDLLVFERWNQYPTAGLRTMAISQALNETILLLLGRDATPHPPGADRQIGRAWGGREPRPSEATDALRDCVARLADDERLDILCLGALTNIASFALLHPGAVPRLRLYILAGGYHRDPGAWDKDEFNVRNDPNALDQLLDTAEADLTFMTTDVARAFAFDKTATYARLDDAVPIQRFLKERWEETNPQDQTRILWDLALVQAYLRPALATLTSVAAPPENLRRPIRLYETIDVAALAEDFWTSLRQTR